MANRWLARRGETDKPGRFDIVEKSASYTLVIGDAGKTIYYTGTTAAQTLTIPADAAVAYPTGTRIKFVNHSNQSVSIALTTDTLTFAANNTTGTRTLAAGGSATAMKVASGGWSIEGSALLT